jgi:hypothetical protein
LTSRYPTINHYRACSEKREGNGLRYCSANIFQFVAIQLGHSTIRILVGDESLQGYE